MKHVVYVAVDLDAIAEAFGEGAFAYREIINFVRSIDNVIGDSVFTRDLIEALKENL